MLTPLGLWAASSLSGNGSQASPYVISSADELSFFATEYNSGKMTGFIYVELGENIDCKDLEFTPIVSFTGEFNGKGHKISNLTYNSGGGAAGLFLNVGEGVVSGIIKNLVMENCTFGGGQFNGAIAACLNVGTIQDCTVNNCTISTEGAVESPMIGGIAGMAYPGCTIQDCTVSGCSISATITTNGGVLAVGGIVGNVLASTMQSGDGDGVSIWRCVVNGTEDFPTTISSSHCECYTGGIVGTCDGLEYYSTISDCSVKGMTTVMSVNTGESGGAAHAGAIVGSHSNTLFTNNHYEYSVTTQTTDGFQDPLIKEGYEQRGTGMAIYIQDETYFDILENDGAVLYTKLLSIGDIGAECSYYEPLSNYAEGTLAFAPGQTVNISLNPEEGEFISSASLVYTPQGAAGPTTVPLVNIAEDPYYYVYEFEMPDANATLNATLEQIVDYDITIAGVTVTNANAADITGDGTVTFTPANNETGTPATLTLEDNTVISVDGDAIVTGISPLRVFIAGVSAITFDGTGSGSVIKGTNPDANISVTFTTDETTIDEYHEIGGILCFPLTASFSGVDVNYENVSLKREDDYFYIDSRCELKVGGTDVTYFNKDNILGDEKVSFTPADNSTTTVTPAVLTLNGASAGAISTSLSTLTVELIGSNTLTQDNDYPVLMSSSREDVTITIQSTGETKGSLTMNMPYTADGNFVGDNVTLNISQPLYVMSGSLTGNWDEENTVVIGMLDCEFHEGWTTYYNADADININNLPEGVGVFVVTGLSENAAVVTQINSIPKGVPVLLNNNIDPQNTTTNVYGTDVKNNMLKHAADAINDVSTLNGTVFGLYNGKFMRVTGSISAGKNYLYIPNATAPNGAPQLTIEFENDDNMTGISDAKCGNENGQNDEWYTLNGQKLQQEPVVKGLYIKNGKKVVVNNK